MILRAGQRNRALAVAKREERRLFSVQEFLDHQFGPGVAKLAGEHSLNRRLRFGQTLRDDHALAGGKPVRFHDHRQAMLAYIGDCRGRGVEAGIGSGWNIVGLAQVLGKSLGAFEARGGPARSERLDSGGGEIIHNAGAERRLRSDHNEINLAGFGKCAHGGMIGGIERHQLAFLRNTGVARRAVEPLNQRASRNLPRQRVLAPARAENKDIHLVPDRLAGFPG